MEYDSSLLYKSTNLLLCLETGIIYTKNVASMMQICKVKGQNMQIIENMLIYASSIYIILYL